MLSKKHEDTSNETLLQRVYEGDLESFDVLFLRYYPMLCAYANQFVSFEDGQEVVQDIMIGLWIHCTKGFEIETSLKNYLFKSVKNRCITLINRNILKRKIIKCISSKPGFGIEDPDFYIVEELIQNIEMALSNLPTNYREAFEMNRFQNLTYNEIATRLNVSPKTVDYRIQKALKLLRSELKDYLPLMILCDLL